VRRCGVRCSTSVQTSTCSHTPVAVSANALGAVAQWGHRGGVPRVRHSPPIPLTCIACSQFYL
jgi:hypothetical protein